MVCGVDFLICKAIDYSMDAQISIVIESDYEQYLFTHSEKFTNRHSPSDYLERIWT